MPRHTRESIRGLQCAVLAGLAAEEMLLCNISSGGGTGSTSDMAQATRFAVEAESGLGFGPRLTWVPPEIHYSLSQEAMRQRIEASLRAAQKEAQPALHRRRSTIKRVAGVLSEPLELDAG